MTCYCYLMECANGAYYAGWTTDPQRRLRVHNRGKGARYIRLNGPARLVYLEELPDKISALKREYEIKQLTHQAKARLVTDKKKNLLRQPAYSPQPASPLAAGEVFTVIAPGRVNLLGEHVDYNDGVVLPAAIDRFVQLRVKVLAEPVLQLHALDLGAETSLSLTELKEKRDLTGLPLPGYACYPAGVAWALQEAGRPTPGLRVSYRSNIPIGAGLSSSAAVSVGFALAWQHAGGWQMDPLALAKACQLAENEYVGVKSGLMDQFACLFGQEGHALQFDTRSLDWEPLPLPPEVTLVIADSGVRRNLACSAYNARRAECEEALRLLSAWQPGLTSLRDISPELLQEFLPQLPEPVGRRARHVVEEIARVQLAGQYLKAADINAFGQLMYASHTSLRDLYEVSCPELDVLVEEAAKLTGCFGARLCGAGFGGCTINLVDRRHARAFIRDLSERYQQKTSKKALIYRCEASRGAHLATKEEAALLDAV